MNGWICLHRKFIEWGWYDDMNAKCLFLHLLLTANIEEREWHGIKVGRGQLVTSVSKLSEALHLSHMQIRRVLNNLKSTKEIEVKATNKYTLITICNYASYQDKPTDEQQTNNKRTTIKQQTDNNQTTTTKQYNNITSKQDNNSVCVNNAHTHAHTQDLGFTQFLEWANANASSVMQMREPLTEQQFLLLRKRYSDKDIATVMFKMSNYAPLCVKNVSTYKTFLSWAKRETAITDKVYRKN